MQMGKARRIAFQFGERAPLPAAVIGGKGAGLTELLAMGASVPPFFTLTTSLARAYQQHQRLPKRLEHQLRWDIATLERQTGKRFGDPSNPLLLSVRSGAEVSMPGMMDTILNLGMNPMIADGLAVSTGNPNFAWDCYRRFLKMYGTVVLGIEAEQFDKVRQPDNIASCTRYRILIADRAGQPIPDDPWEQLYGAIEAVLKSWDNPRARQYRNINKIPDDLGTAVNIQAMVFGNRDAKSGTGVVFSRNCNTGSPGIWGECLRKAQGEDVVDGSTNPDPIEKLSNWNPQAYKQLTDLVARLEAKHRRVVEVEFTIESGRLYILQVRNAKLMPEAAITVAVNFTDKGIWSREFALRQVSQSTVHAAMGTCFEPNAASTAVVLAKGQAAVLGAASGEVVLSSAEAVRATAKGRQVILVAHNTTPDDLPGMFAAAGIVTSFGGSTCHAAVVARSLNKPCVVGCESLNLPAGTLVSVDGHQGLVLSGQIPLINPVERKKEVNILLRWLRKFDTAVRWPEPRLHLKYAEHEKVAEKLLKDFYLAEGMVTEAAGTTLQSKAIELRAAIHVETAERLAVYLTIACGGELDHKPPYPDRCHVELTELLEQFKFSPTNTRGGYGVAENFCIELLSPLSLKRQKRFLLLAATVFRNGWHSGTAIGGERWAKLAEMALGFLDGRLPHTVMADQVFNMRHNGMRLFNKHPMIKETGDLDAALEFKRTAQGLNDLYKKLSAIKTSSRVEALYQEGIKSNIWKSI